MGLSGRRAGHGVIGPAQRRMLPIRSDGDEFGFELGHHGVGRAAAEGQQTLERGSTRENGAAWGNRTPDLFITSEPEVVFGYPARVS